jgi:hypothetical protein
MEVAVGRRRRGNGDFMVYDSLRLHNWAMETAALGLVELRWIYRPKDTHIPRLAQCRISVTRHVTT